ncbi:diguanylate cyclase [Cohnella sp.]|uniref:sensor domain-containing diguanylate cyclase n=1 Tax=Cohnella sp. TaxID=1883426 RepID=UPI0035614BFD
MVIDLIANFSLLTAFLFFLNSIIRKQVTGLQSKLQTKVFVGVTHGLFSIVLMFFSVQVTSTTILDFRQLMIISAANFGGIYSSILASLIIAAGRILLFGGMNESSLVAASSSVALGIGSGLLMKLVNSYWRRWSFSIGLSVILAASTLYYLLREDSFNILPSAMIFLIFGGLATAALIAHFAASNKLQLELKESDERYRRLNAYQDAIFASSIGVSLIATDVNGNITLFNKGAEVILGYTAEEVVGKVNAEFFHDITEFAERGKQLSREYNRPITGFNIYIEYVKSGRTDGREWTYVHKDGKPIIVNLFISPLEVDGVLLGYIGVATDITERKKAEEKLRKANEILQELSLQDGLTGFSNRRHFDEALEREWISARKDSSSLSLILFDIDYFKNYNDSYGHQAGDECLRTVAAMLKAMIQRKTDIYARYGGEEFALILPNTNIDRAAGIAELVRLAIEACAIPNAESQVSEFITISAGVATVNPDTMPDFNALVAEADALLYKAKQEGRNRVKASIIESQKG